MIATTRSMKEVFRSINLGDKMAGVLSLKFVEMSDPCIKGSKMEAVYVEVIVDRNEK